MKFGTVLVLIALLAAVANASPVISFNSTAVSGHAGTISYSNGGVNAGKAVGTNVDIDSLVGTGTVANDGVALKCFGCVLNFQTGSVIDDRSAGGTAWSFNGGGFFTITGAADLNMNGIQDVGETSATLLSGIFNTPVSVVTPTGSSGQFLNDLKFTSATLINHINNQVDFFYGNAGNSVYDGLYNQTFISSRQMYLNNTANPNLNRWVFTTWASPNGMLDGFVDNKLVVPEPISVLLFGTAGGVLALVAVRRRKSS